MISTHPLRACPDRASPAFFCKPSPTNLFGQSASLEHCRAEFTWRQDQRCNEALAALWALACRYNRYDSDQPSTWSSPAGCKEALAALLVELGETAHAAAGHEGVEQWRRRSGRHGRRCDGRHWRHCQHVARVQQLA